LTYPTQPALRIDYSASLNIVENSFFTLGDPALYRQNDTMSGKGTYIANNEDMYKQETYVGWDFVNVWYPPEEGRLPKLRALFEKS
jgi:hypothetical protein